MTGAITHWIIAHMTDLASGWSEGWTPHPVVRHTLIQKNSNAWTAPLTHRQEGALFF
jgi:hypothetical protein